MGGELRSRFELERERAEKLRLTGKIDALSRQLEGLRGALAEGLSTSTPGIRRTFAAEVSVAVTWDSLASKIENRGTEFAELTVLQQLHARLKSVVKEGERIVTQLLLCFSKKGDEMASQLARRLVELQTTIAKHSGQCATWFPEEVAQWSADVQRASELCDQEQFGAATARLNVLETNIEQIVAKTRELGAKHQSRICVLKAVRQVCCDLGMRETAPPRQERSNDPTSRILLTVASPDRGKLSFALTLDGIESDGEAHRCGKDLDHLSRHLAERYGVRTKFRRPAEHDDPRLTRRRERRLPVDDETLSEVCEG